MKILVTGGAGVVGVPLMRMIGGRHEIVALARHRSVDHADTVVRGDLTQPELGLSRADRDLVLDGLDCVVHCAANVIFDAGAEAMNAVNVDGTRRVLGLAQAAGARFVHVSTAFVEMDLPPDSSGGYASLRPSEYLESKRAGEALVRSSGLPYAIVRPSAISGDSFTGEITEYQGVHSVSRSLLRNTVPLFLCAATARFDLVPCDVVAAMIAAVVESEVGGVFWATMGPNSMTADRLLDIVAEVAAERGIRYGGTRRADPEVFERLLKPAFFDELGDREKTKMANLMTTVAALFPRDPMPTSLGTIPNAPAEYSAADAENVMRTTLRYLIDREGLATRELMKEVVA
ncbi:SDR family oxidoreductase [Nocardia salmonicida]|uniref:SDR family oxidoreductase n=1 Tax=Nocardia salmonicida TaxID=53431 RepID=UPI00366CB1DB